MIVEIPPFTNCPKCGDVLLNKFYEDKSDGDFWIKSCIKRPDHQFKCTVKGDEKFMNSVTLSLSMNPLLRAAWDFRKGTLEVAKGTIEELIRSGQDPDRLPFFVPDFSNYNELIHKIKLYMTFS